MGKYLKLVEPFFKISVSLSFYGLLNLVQTAVFTCIFEGQRGRSKDMMVTTDSGRCRLESCKRPPPLPPYACHLGRNLAKYSIVYSELMI